MAIHLLTGLPQRRMISGMQGQNYWFNGCMAYLMEYLGEHPAYDYWFFSGVTGDSFVQVHGGDPRRMTLCYSDVMTADAAKRAFRACGYAFEYVPHAERDELDARIRQSLAAGMPVIARIDDAFHSFAVICGWDEDGLYGITGEQDAPTRCTCSEAIFVGGRTVRPALAESYREAVMNIPRLLTLPRAGTVAFGREAFEAWAGSFKSGKLSAYAPDDAIWRTHPAPDFRCWNVHGAYLCMLGTNACAIGFLQTAREYLESRICDALIPLYEKQCLEGFAKLIGMESGLGIAPEAVRNPQRMRQICDEILRLGAYCDDITSVFAERMK